MTTFNLNGAGPPARFTFEDGGWVELTLPDAKALKEIEKATTTRTVEYKRVEGKAERFEIVTADGDQRDLLFWDKIIMAWGDLYDSKHQAIPCTAENKMLLLAKSERFRTLVLEGLETLRADAAMAEQADAKN